VIAFIGALISNIWSILRTSAEIAVSMRTRCEPRYIAEYEFQVFFSLSSAFYGNFARASQTASGHYDISGF
jgi:hypothetical protein